LEARLQPNSERLLCGKSTIHQKPFLKAVLNVKATVFEDSEHVEMHDEYFRQRPNATSKLGIFSIQKCIVAIKQLAYGFSTKACDELESIA